VNDLEMARTVPCPGCKRPADAPCIDLESGREVPGVHQVRIYRAYVVAEADAHNRAVEMTDRVRDLVIAGVRNQEIHRRSALPLLDAVGIGTDESRALVAQAEEQS